MRCKIKMLSVNGIPASDGSLVTADVMNDYINSQECKKALANHTMMGSLTHRCRNIATVFPDKPELKKTVGKDDSLLIVNTEAPTPTHYIDDLFIEGGWLWGYITILPEDGFDDLGKQNIRRLKALLNNGVRLGGSCVIVGFWSSDGISGSKNDYLKKCVCLKGFDLTNNPSWKDAGIKEIYDDDGDRIDADQKDFSEKEFSDNFKSGEIKVKTFSATDLYDGPKTSKISGEFTFLKAKEFSTLVEVGGINSDSNYNSSYIENPVQKNYTMVGIKDRLKEARMSPRMRFRRMYISYKQVIKAMGGVEKMDEETISILKSMFATDVMDIMKTLTNDIRNGKQITTLIGAASLGKSVRVAAQKLQMPYRMTMNEVSKQGQISKARLAAISQAYADFVAALTEDVFGSNPSPIPSDNENEEEED